MHLLIVVKKPVSIFCIHSVHTFSALSVSSLSLLLCSLLYSVQSRGSVLKQSITTNK